MMSRPRLASIWAAKAAILIKEINKMENDTEENVYNKFGPLTVLIGALVGGLAGATAMWLFAPQSGRRTRAQIQNKTIQLRDRTTTNIKKAVAQVRSETGKLTAGVSEKAGELKQLGQDKLVQQMDRVSAALDAGKTAVETA
jgi:gas vesicle protein